MRRTLFIAATGLVIAPMTSAFNLVRDPDSEVPIVWQMPAATMMLQQNGSRDISDGSDLVAVRSALATWNAVGCSSFRFTDGGLTNTRAQTQDGVNVITWVDVNWPGAVSGAGAYTTRYLDSSSPKHWVEADIAINGQEYTWGTDGDVHKIDVQGVVLHELGHVLGFSHSVSPQAVMYFRAQGGTTYARTLDADEIAGICFLYPTSAFSCTGDEKCPIYWAPYGGNNLQTHCTQGTCTPGPSSSYGAACFLDGDCTSGHCAVDPAMPPTTEPGFCTIGCTPGTSSCPNGDYCHAEAMNRCYVGRDDCIADSDCMALGRNWVCDRDLDGRSRCRHLCLQNSNCAAVAGTVCHGGLGMNPPGFCRIPGPKAEGERCRSGLECQSLACTEGGPVPTCGAGVPGFGGDGGPGADASGGRDASSPRPDAGGGGTADGAGGNGSDASGAVDGALPAGGTDGSLDQGDASGSSKMSGHCGCTSLERRTPPEPSSFVILAMSILGLVSLRNRKARSARLPRNFS